MQEIKFENEVFKRVSTFFKESSGKFQQKKAEVILMMFREGKETKLSERLLDLSKYVGKGLVRDNIEMSGNVYFLEFEICIGGMTKQKDDHSIRSSVLDDDMND